MDSEYESDEEDHLAALKHLNKMIKNTEKFSTYLRRHDMRYQDNGKGGADTQTDARSVKRLRKKRSKR